MSYAGMYDPTPIPEPASKPEMRVVLACGETVWVEPWWWGDPLYGGWKPPAFGYCTLHRHTSLVRREAWPPERRSKRARDV